MSAERGRARDFVAMLRSRGVVLKVDLDTLKVTYEAPMGALTAEIWAEWKALSVDVTAELLAEVATVAYMAHRAGLPTDIKLIYRPAVASPAQTRRPARTTRAS